MTKEHPEWKNAVTQILQRVDEEGQGCFFSHDEIRDYLSLAEPTDKEEYKKWCFTLFGEIDKVRKELLEEHNLYLDSNRGKGYQILTPKEQVVNASVIHFKKARRELSKAVVTLTNVNTFGLQMEDNEMRISRLNKLGFINVALKKNSLLTYS